MFFARFVVEQDFLLQRVLEDGVGDFSSFAGSCRRDFEHVVGHAGIAARVHGYLLQEFISRTHFHFAQPALAVFERASQKANNLFFRQRLEDVNAAAREQRAVDLK